jgi:hypothetical protein
MLETHYPAQRLDREHERLDREHESRLLKKGMVRAAVA